jgi:hypothetical protein
LKSRPKLDNNNTYTDNSDNLFSFLILVSGDFKAVTVWGRFLALNKNEGQQEEGESGFDSFWGGGY